MDARSYLAIDLKSFYASEECVERGLDPLDANLVVADRSRTSKTICLAVSPSLKALGIGGRPRLFEVEECMREVNEERRLHAPGRRFTGGSSSAAALAADPSLKAEFIVAKPRMAHYLEASARIYGIYLRYADAKDIHVYSVDEVFIDATSYLGYFGCDAHELARRIVAAIAAETGITATAGIGTNLYLAKVAMDIVAKHVPADADGVRIARLDEMAYRRSLWAHRPLTDFWRVGPGVSRTLERHGLMTMGDVARCSVGSVNDYYNEGLLYRLFGVNAELLIDHAWGWEPCTIADIKRYRPARSTLSCGQVLREPYDWRRARTIVLEMADEVAYELLGHGDVTDHVTLTVGYDVASLGGAHDGGYMGPVDVDRYGRRVPKSAHGSHRMEAATANAARLREAFAEIFDRVVDPRLLVRRVTVGASKIALDGADGSVADGHAEGAGRYKQPDLFAAADGRDPDELSADGRRAGGRHADGERSNGRSVSERGAGERDVGGQSASGARGGDDHGGRGDVRRDADRDARELAVQRALLGVKERFGGNAVITGLNLEDGATGVERNRQIGGHAA